MSKELHHLFKAIKENKLDQVKVAIKNNQSLVNAKDDKGQTALIVAAEFGTTGIIDDLLKHGGQINYQLPSQLYTPLIIAARAGKADIVKYLLDHGADSQSLDAQGKNALMYATENNQPQIVALLERKQ